MEQFLQHVLRQAAWYLAVDSLQNLNHFHPSETLVIILAVLNSPIILRLLKGFYNDSQEAKHGGFVSKPASCQSEPFAQEILRSWRTSATPSG